jgi:hypothetical protein
MKFKLPLLSILIVLLSTLAAAQEIARPGDRLAWDHEGGADSFTVYIDDVMTADTIALEWDLNVPAGPHVAEVTAKAGSEESARSEPLAFIMQVGWTRLTSWSAEDLLEWGGRLVADFGTRGLWVYEGGAWSKITGWDAIHLEVVGTALVADFGPGRGLWTYE